MRSARHRQAAERCSTSISTPRRSPRSVLQRPGVLQRGDRAVLREAALMAGGELAGVERRRGDPLLGDPDFDAAAERTRGRASSRWYRNADTDRAAPGSPSGGRDRGSRSGSARITSSSSASRSTGRRAAAVRPALAFSNHASSCSWKSSWFANRRPGSKFVSIYSCSRSTAPFACGSPGSQKCQSTGSCPQNAGIASRRAPAAGVQRALAVPDQLSGSAPSDHKQRAMPHSRSGASLEKISAPAPTRE